MSQMSAIPEDKYSKSLPSVSMPNFCFNNDIPLKMRTTVMTGQCC